MSKYYEGILYKGNVVKNNNGKKETIKDGEGVYLIYSKNKDCFYNHKVLNELLDLELNRHLSPEDREEKIKKVSEYTYNYSITNKNDKPFVDESTIIAYIIPPEIKKISKG